jgi:hypothetical protein
MDSHVGKVRSTPKENSVSWGLSQPLWLAELCIATDYIQNYTEDGLEYHPPQILP